MFVSYRFITRILVIIVAITLVVTPFGIAYTLYRDRDYYTIVIDAGHGGMDGGVVGSSGVKESDINLELARLLEKRLLANGDKVIMTRRTKDAIASTKREDMERRRRIIKGAGADMVISIHVNKFSDSRRRGVQVFYDDLGRSERTAKVMQTIMNDYINKTYAGRTDISELSGDFFITKCDSVPSIIVECGFISNSEDERLLLDKTYREELVEAMRVGIYSALSYR